MPDKCRTECVDNEIEVGEYYDSFSELKCTVPECDCVSGYYRDENSHNCVGKKRFN